MPPIIKPVSVPVLQKTYINKQAAAQALQRHDPLGLGLGQTQQVVQQTKDLAKQGHNVANSVKDIGAMADTLDDVADVGKVSKLSKGLDMANKFAAPLQAGMSVAGLGMDIYNTIEANKQMKEQMDLAKKNFNLELEKQQKHELANNQLAASIDKAWGGSGEVAPTIDYSKYRPMKYEGLDMVQDKSDGGALIQGGAGQGMVMGANSNANARSIDSTQTPNTDNTELGGSGNMPTLSLGGAGGMPVGHSESIDTDNNDHEEDGTEAS
ncbi:MAG: hypothetical protein SPJ16_09460 [Helicobacter sp.]|uniref:hypothetical protein n=1 Tax=Helicobacter sp. TaxID=218 RepID=UPI002A91C059|nr:hypothetical protein [Helicobacter sp.]MDY5951402.1 hypothetical protein [Helicobacter sp.]